MPKTFREYVAGRKRMSITAWGDFVRAGLKNGTLPNFESWKELRAFVLNYSAMNIKLDDAQATWHRYRQSEKLAEAKAAAETPDNKKAPPTD